MTKDEADQQAELMKDDEAGLYWEEVEKIVENLVDRVANDEFEDLAELEQEVNDHLNMSCYCNLDDLAIVVLKYSKHPTAELFHHGLGSWEENHWGHGKEGFPFCRCAYRAMYADCMEALNKRSELKELKDTSLSSHTINDEEEEADGEGKAEEE